jgi:hypothetical protein
MGGKITLKSTISVGSTFTLCIPLHYLKEQATSVTASLGGPGSTRPGSLVNSLVGRSLYDEPKTPMSPRREPSPAPTSGYATGDRLLDVPRIVGFSQPYLTDYDASQSNHEPSTSTETAKAGLSDPKEIKQPTPVEGTGGYTNPGSIGQQGEPAGNLAHVETRKSSRQVVY